MNAHPKTGANCYLRKRGLKKSKYSEMMDVLINSIVGILLQCIHTSNHHTLYFIILFVKYTSMKLKKKKKEKVAFRDERKELYFTRKYIILLFLSK